MWLFCFSIFCFLFFVREVFPYALKLREVFSQNEARSLLQVEKTLLDFREKIETGLVPSERDWERLKGLPHPWSNLSFEMVHELRSAGSPILPVLSRIQVLASTHREGLLEGKARASQAVAQVWICSLLVPAFGAALYSLLPELQEQTLLWVGVSLSCLLFTAFGAYWVLRLSEAARWGGLRGSHRGWLLFSQVTIEKFLALLISGAPADLAWVRAIEFLSKEEPELAQAWQANLWQSSPLGSRKRADAEMMFLTWGDSLKQSIQAAVMEGRGCRERVETLLIGFQQDFRARVQRELTLLGTKVLKPLFICVAPALLGQLAAALVLMGLFALEI
jgi:hypothetical protein